MYLHRCWQLGRTMQPRVLQNGKEHQWSWVQYDDAAPEDCVQIIHGQVCTELIIEDPVQRKHQSVTALLTC